MLPFEGEGDRDAGDGALVAGDGARDEAKEMVTCGAMSSGVGEDMLILRTFLFLVFTVWLLSCLLLRVQFVTLWLLWI